MIILQNDSDYTEDRKKLIIVGFCCTHDKVLELYIVYD